MEPKSNEFCDTMGTTEQKTSAGILQLSDTSSARRMLGSTEHWENRSFMRFKSMAFLNNDETTAKGCSDLSESNLAE